MEQAAQAMARLLAERIVYLGQELQPPLVQMLRAQFQALATQPEKPASLILSASGGDWKATLDLLEVLQSLPYPLSCVALGQVAGPPVVLLAAAARGNRLARSDAQIRVTPPTPAAQTADMQAYLHEVRESSQRYFETLAQLLGKPLAEVQAWGTQGAVSAQQALQWGLIDRVLPA